MLPVHLLQALQTVVCLQGHRSVRNEIKSAFLPCLLVCLALNKCVVLSGTGFDEEAALLGAGREFALMKTASGKVRGKIFHENVKKRKKDRIG